MGMLREQGRVKTLKRVLTAAAAADILLLCLFKYTAAGLPVGISFYTFSVLSYLFDIMQEAAEPQRNLLNFALYVSFFPKITSGPIAQYRDMEKQISKIRISQPQLFRGLQLFLVAWCFTVCSFIMISADIRTWPLALRVSSGLRLNRTSITRTCRNPFRSSGGDGISRWAHGSASMCTYRWAETGFQTAVFS